MEKGFTSKTVAKTVAAIYKLASRKTGVTRAQAMEKLEISPVQWARARKKAKLKMVGAARTAVYFAK